MQFHLFLNVESDERIHGMLHAIYFSGISRSVWVLLAKRSDLTVAFHLMLECIGLLCI